MDAVLNFIKFVLDTVNKFFFICEGPHYRRQPLRLPQNKTKQIQTSSSKLLETCFAVSSTGLENPECT